MNRKGKKLLAGILLVLMAVAAAPAQRIVSYAAQGKITFSDPSVTVGNTVSVTMKITSTSGEGLGASDVMLGYDASKLEFVSGTGANGGAGSVRVLGTMESGGQTSFSFTLKFKALKAGDTAISIASQQVYDESSQAVTITHEGSSSVKVKAPVTYSKEASLSSLEISPGELSPAFSADVTSYTASVSGDVEKLSVGAPAKDGKAKVEISGNENLQTGENTVVCKVTAEDGTTTKSYTITVTKTEGTAPEDGSVGVSVNAQASGTDVKINDKSYQVAAAFDAAALPAGFEQTEIDCGGIRVQAGQNAAAGMIVVYLTDESGKGDFFLYDSGKESFAPYVTVEMAEKSVTVLPIESLPEDMKLPDGFAECSIDIGEYTVRGWIWSVEGDATSAAEYCVVYAANENGEKNLYRYDQKEMTLQRYFQDPAAENVKTLYTDLAGEFNSLLDDYKVRGFIIAGLFAVSLILLIILIVLLMRKPKGPHRRGYDEDYGYMDGRRHTGRKAADIADERSGRSLEEDFDDDYDDYGESGPGDSDRGVGPEDRELGPEPGRTPEPAKRAQAGRSTEPGRSTEARRSPEAGRSAQTRRTPEAGRSAQTRRAPEAGRSAQAGRAPDSGRGPEPGRAPESGRVRREAPRSVDEMEKDIAAGLAREASGAVSGRKDRRAGQDDDDFEFFDLDL